MLRTLPRSTVPGATSGVSSTGSPGLTWPRLFSVRSACTQTSRNATKVISGWPTAAKLPASTRRSVTSPSAGATIVALRRSRRAWSSVARAARIWGLFVSSGPRCSLAFSRSAAARSTAARAASVCGLLSSNGPRCSVARARSASARCTPAAASVSEASAISMRRRDTAPGSSSAMRFRRIAFCLSLTRLAFADSSAAAAATTAAEEARRFCAVKVACARAEATAASAAFTVAVEARRFCSARASCAAADATASSYCSGSICASRWPLVTNWLFVTSTASTLPLTCGAIGTTKAFTRAWLVNGVNRSPSRYQTSSSRQTPQKTRMLLRTGSMTRGGAVGAAPGASFGGAGAA